MTTDLIYKVDIPWETFKQLFTRKSTNGGLSVREWFDRNTTDDSWDWENISNSGMVSIKFKDENNAVEFKLLFGNQ